MYTASPKIWTQVTDSISYDDNRCARRTYINIYIYTGWTGSLPLWIECSPMVQEACVQSQVASYQRLKKCYLMPPFLTLSIIMYVSRVKWSNPGKGVALSPAPRCSSYWKGSLLVTLDYAPFVTRHTSSRLLSSCQTCCSMSPVTLFSAERILCLSSSMLAGRGRA